MYELEIRLVPEVAATFTVGVVREGEDWSAAEERGPPSWLPLKPQRPPPPNRRPMLRLPLKPKSLRLKQPKPRTSDQPSAEAAAEEPEE